MAIQKDYILRMIEMMAELIAGILGLIKKGQFQQAEASLDRAYNELLKEDSAFFNGIPLEKLTDTLIREHNYTHGHLEVLSELFFAQGELDFSQGKQQESLPYYERSLKLLEFILDESRTFSFDKDSRRAMLEQRLRELRN